MKSRLIRFFLYDITLFCITCSFLLLGDSFYGNPFLDNDFLEGLSCILCVASVFIFILLILLSIAGYFYYRKKDDSFERRMFPLGAKGCVLCAIIELIIGFISYITDDSDWFTGLLGVLIMWGSVLWLIPLLLNLLFNFIEKRSERFQHVLSARIKPYELAASGSSVILLIASFFINNGF